MGNREGLGHGGGGKAICGTSGVGMGGNWGGNWPKQGHVEVGIGVGQGKEGIVREGG